MQRERVIRPQSMAVQCAVCGKIDDGAENPPGTSIRMQCNECEDESGRASRCRVCCPTGHGTRFLGE